MSPQFFPTATDFRKWLEKNHDKETEILVGFYKVGSGKPSMNWPESVDEALCFGWIDGVRKSIDTKSYSIRFTPRKPGSIWSAVNIKKVEALQKAQLMTPAGIAAFEKRDAKRSAIYSYEKDIAKLPLEMEQKFRKNKKAWDFFTAQAPSYQKAAIHLIVSAKQEKTQQQRLETLISDSKNGRKIKPLSR